MDKSTIIRMALRRLGEREYKQQSAVYDPVNIYFDSVMRECNARHHWTFARRICVPLTKWHPVDDVPRHHHHHHHHHHPVPPFYEPDDGEMQDMPENALEGTKKPLVRHGWHKLPHNHPYPPSRGCQAAFFVPGDCLRIMTLRDAGGAKVMHWTLGMDVDRNERVIYTPENDDVMLTYTADLLQCGACVPDFAPMYCNGVISMLAARLAPSMLGSEQMAQTLIAEAEAYLKEAIIEDRRQERSNDQHPLADILDMDITRYRTFKSQLYY